MRFPNLTKKQVEYEIKQWRSQPARVYLETQFEIIFKTDLCKEPVSQVPTVYLYSKRDNYIDMKKTRVEVGRTLPNTTFMELPLTEHVPKGEFSLQMIKSMEDMIEPVVRKIQDFSR